MDPGLQRPKKYVDHLRRRVSLDRAAQKMRGQEGGMGGGRIRLFAALFVGALAAVAWAPKPVLAQTLPAMKFVTASLVSPAAAVTHYGTATTHTNSLAGVPGFGAT